MSRIPQAISPRMRSNIKRVKIESREQQSKYHVFFLIRHADILSLFSQFYYYYEATKINCPITERERERQSMIVLRLKS